MLPLLEFALTYSIHGLFWIQLENFVIALTAEIKSGDDDFNLSTPGLWKKPERSMAPSIIANLTWREALKKRKFGPLAETRAGSEGPIELTGLKLPP